MDNLIDFDDLRVGSKAVKKIVQAFTRAGAPVVATDIDGKTRRSSGVSYRSLFLTFADGQKVELMVKAPGDIFGVKINGSLKPMKNQADQKKAVAELVGYLDAGRAKFQAKLARTKAELPKGIRTAAPRMEVALKTRTEYLDGEIAKAKTTIRTLKEELGEPVMDAVKSAFMAFNVNSAMGKFTAIVKVEAGMSDKDAKSDAIELAQSELGGRSANVLGSGKKLTKPPDDSWESKKAKGWGWMAKGYLVPVMDSAVLDAARRMNQKDYAFYVVINGKIESGWEYAEDAKEYKDENMPAKWRSGAKVIRKNGLKALNLDPDNNESWHDLKSLPMLDDAGEPEEADNDLTGNLFAMDSAELAEAIELAKIVNSGSVLDSASMDHAVATLKVALDTVQHNLPINEAKGNADQAALEREAIESIQAALDCLCGEARDARNTPAQIISQTGPSKAVHQRNVDVGRSDSAELIDVPDESKGGGSVAVQTNPALDDAGEPAFINPFRKGSK